MTVALQYQRNSTVMTEHFLKIYDVVSQVLIPSTEDDNEVEEVTTDSALLDRSNLYSLIYALQEKYYACIH